MYGAKICIFMGIWSETEELLRKYMSNLLQKLKTAAVSHIYIYTVIYFTSLLRFYQS